jgi:hypothetical protein
MANIKGGFMFLSRKKVDSISEEERVRVAKLEEEKEKIRLAAEEERMRIAAEKALETKAKDEKMKERFGEARHLYRVCAELKIAEEEFRSSLSTGIELVDKCLKDPLLSTVKGFLAPCRALVDTTAFNSVNVEEAFSKNPPTYDVIIPELCNELDTHIERTRGIFRDGVINRGEITSIFAEHHEEVDGIALDEESVNFTTMEPSVLPFQRILKYSLHLRDMLDNAKRLNDPERGGTPNTVSEATIKRIEATIAKIKALSDELNTVKLFSIHEQKLADIIIKCGVSSPQIAEAQVPKVKKEIIEAIKTGKPEDIRRVLTAYGFKEVSTEKNPTGAITLETASAIKQGYNGAADA